MIDCMDLPRGGWVICKNDSVYCDCMGDSVEYDRKDKYDVNVLK